MEQPGILQRVSMGRGGPGPPSHHTAQDSTGAEVLAAWLASHWNPSSILFVNSKQMNKQTKRPKNPIIEKTMIVIKGMQESHTKAAH